MGISVDREKIVLRKHVSRIVIPSEAEGSFSLAVKGSVLDSEKWETPYRRKGGDGASLKGLAKESWKKGTKKISRCARNDSVGEWICFSRDVRCTKVMKASLRTSQSNRDYSL